VPSTTHQNHLYQQQQPHNYKTTTTTASNNNEKKQSSLIHQKTLSPNRTSKISRETLLCSCKSNSMDASSSSYNNNNLLLLYNQNKIMQFRAAQQQQRQQQQTANKNHHQQQQQKNTQIKNGFLGLSHMSRSSKNNKITTKWYTGSNTNNETMRSCSVDITCSNYGSKTLKK
jgi:hypothetical protein